MTSRNSDVNLVIRARTEGEKLIESLATTLSELYGEANHSSTGLKDLGKAVADLDKAFATINGKADGASAAFERQRDRVAKMRAEYDALKGQAAAAAAAIQKLSSAEVIVGAGRDGQGQRLAQLKAASAEQESLSSKVEKAARLLAQQTAAAEGSRSSLQRLGSTVIAVEEAQGIAAGRIAKTTEALEQQTAAANRAAVAQANSSAVSEKVNRVTGVSRPAATNGGATFEALSRQNTSDAAAIRELREQLDPLAAAQGRFNGQLERYRALAAAGKIESHELAAAEALIAKNATLATEAYNRTNAGGSHKLQLFGLKPYELQNLGYQINDVVTQLASGTSLSQTLAQQGGQILQLFPKVTGSIVALATNPGFLAAVAVVGGIALALKESADHAERLKHYTADLSFRADGGSYKAADLSQQERAFEHLGASSEEARKAVSEFLDAGVAPDKLKVFGDTAQNLAEVMGIKLPDAAKLVADALTQGYQAVEALDEKYHFLTASQREHIRALFDEGKAADARNEALGILARKSEEFANNQRGPWAGATRELKAAWSEFLDTIGDSETLKIAGKAVGKLAEAAKLAAADIRSATDAGAAATVLQGRREYQQKLEKFDAENTKNAGGKQSQALREQIEVGRAAIREAEENLRRLGGDPTGGVGGKASAVKIKPGGDGRTNAANSASAKEANGKITTLRLQEELTALQDAGGARVLSLAERRRREEVAGIIAFRAQADSAVGAEERRLAIAHERAKIEKETDTQTKAAAAERERAINQFENRVVKAEGGSAKNPHSSARGAGQFIDSTFIGYYRQIPGLDQEVSREQILAQRSDPKIAGAIIDAEARDLAKQLEKAGKTVSAGNLYLLHFLGASTGKAVLNARSDEPVDQVIRRADPKLAGQILSGNKQYLYTENGTGRPRTAGELQTFIAGRVGDKGIKQSEGVDAQDRLREEGEKRQQNLNQALKDENTDRARLVEGLTAENGLRDHALIAAERKAAIDKAAIDIQKKVDDANKNLDPNDKNRASVTSDQVEQAKALAAALFDIQHAKDSDNADIAGPARRIDEYREEVSLLRQEYDFLLSIGDTQSAAKIDKQIVDVNKTLASAIDDLVATYQKLTPSQLKTLGLTDKALKNIVTSLKQGKQATQEFGKIAGVSAQDIAHAFGSSAANALTNFINKVAGGKNVFKSLGESVLEFAANFASAVAQMILQILAYAAAVAILKALGVSVPGFGFGGGGGFTGAQAAAGASAFSYGQGSIGSQVSDQLAGVHHAGGIVGAGGPTRTVSADWWRGAQRFHTGGVIGFAPDEVPILAKKGEEVLTANDGRHRANGGMGGSPNIHIINATDPEHAAEIMLRTKAGERAILNLVSNNPRAFKAALQS